MPKDEGPKVYCPKEEKEVPVWYCIGSYIEQKKGCPELIEATVRVVDNSAEVKCKAQESD